MKSLRGVFLAVPDLHGRTKSLLHITGLILIFTVVFCQTAMADDFRKIMKQAEQGDPVANYELGKIYSKGAGIGQDHTKAAACFAEAAKKGNAAAQYELACMYYGGMGVERDSQKANSLFAAAADKGNAEAQYFLARRYNKGRGVKKNFRKAAYWYSKAAQQGHPEAQKHLQNLCEDRPAVCKDIDFSQ